jgi:hypothetical protein
LSIPKGTKQHTKPLTEQFQSEGRRLLIPKALTKVMLLFQSKAQIVSWPLFKLSAADLRAIVDA